MTELYMSNTYITPIDYIKSSTIIEYDISKSNISMLYSKNMIDKNLYNYLYRLPKQDRENYVGNLIRFDKTNKLYEGISSGVIEAKKNLFMANNILNKEVVRIANDAVFVKRSVPLKYTKFGLIEFIPKNKYSSFIKLGDLYIFFGSSMDDLNIDIINLGKNQTVLHSDYMITFIANILYLAENNSVDAVISYFNEFYQRYLNRELPIGYYREFNSNSDFTIITGKGIVYGLQFIDNTDHIEIGYNASILRKLYSIIISTYRPR